MQPQAPTRSSGPALFAFIAAATLVFGYIGADLGGRLADATLPDAKRFIEKGGSIETSKLDMYQRLPLIGFLGCGAAGAVAGWGFYTAWQRPKSAA